MPSRTGVIERLRGMAGLLKVGVRLRSHADDLLAVADLLEAGEGRTEYRVVGENFRGEPYVTETPFADLTNAEANLRGWKTGGALSGRIQRSEVIRTPWVDVEPEEAQQ